ncbi:MAG: WD40/YVTN/BNR-like repeat-containing protein [Anaerolineae bacterium]
MNIRLCLATANGLFTFEHDGGDWREIAAGLSGRRVTSAIAREGVILAGTTDGVFRSDDLGRSWREASAGLTIRHVRWLAYHPDVSDLEFAGTEPAGIFVSRDGAETWRACPEVAGLRDAHGWSLPYSREAGCVRGFAFHGTRAYAAVEVGGALRSDDGGETWRLAEGSSGNPDPYDPPAPFICPDVHSIAVHPHSPELVLAPTGGGLYRSTNGGKTWTSLYDCYCRAAWLDPDDPAHLILGPADFVDSRGRIEETRDGGQTWQLASTRLDVPWRRYMVERFAQVGDELLAVLSNGHLLAAPLSTLEWRRILPQVKGINCVTAL